MGACTLGFAQGPEGPPFPGESRQGPRREHRSDPFHRFGQGVLAKLDLSAEQKKRIDVASKPHLQAIRNLSDRPMPPMRRREEIQRHVREMQADIQAILTPEQRTEMKRLLDEARQKMRDRMRRGGPFPPPAG